MIVLSLVAFVFISIVAIFMKKHQSLMAHPNILVFGILISQAMVSWQALLLYLGTESLICKADLDILLSASVFGS